MSMMRAVEVQQQGGPLVLVERPIPEPAAHEVRVRVQACGVCHSDSITVGGYMPGITWPRIPGHEVVGIVDAIGADVAGWSVGTRVGVGWNSGNCGYCAQCRHGNAFACETIHDVTGVYRDGGYADYMVAHASALARMPDDLDSVDSAPLLCAGITTFNAIRNSGAAAGDLVAVHGIGGLGHLAVQFASKLGYRTVAIARGADKASFARDLGAHAYIDSTAEDPAKALQAMGGARAIIATVTDAAAMASVVGGLAPNGTLMVIGAVGQIEIDSLYLLTNRAAVKGWYSGTSIDSEDALKFSALEGVTSMNEVYALDDAQAAYDRMMSGKARFRVVLKIAD
jgi:D-arabinose 1-dehydrogenase-like Zn-dependent alcohol dehydrogenase